MNIKKIIVENGWFSLIFFIVLCNCVVQCALFDSGFFSKADEAYCLIKCRDAYDNIITGKSQWDLIAVRWFPYFDLTDKVSSCWSAFILLIATAFNATLSACVLARKNMIFKYLSIFLPLLKWRRRSNVLLEIIALGKMNMWSRIWIQY